MWKFLFKKKPSQILELQGFQGGDSAGIQTQDLQNRNLTLHSLLTLVFTYV